jgi:DNA (cytosine-5)-methyltransferase 1
MMPAPRLLDLFCCEGGASMGYARAGFSVTGVDLFRYRGPDGKLRGYRQARYPFESVQADALEYVAEHGHRFDVIAASPPCQLYSISANAHHNTDHPDLVAPTRAALKATGRPYVIENVEGAPLDHPLMLCGSEFDLRATDTDGLRVWLKRHRLFESNVFLLGNGGCRHPVGIMCAGVYSNGSPSRDAAAARAGGYTPPSQAVRAELMGIDWMSRNGLSQAIPPAYTEHVGRQLLEAVGG